MVRLFAFIFFGLFLSGNGKQNLYKLIPEYANISYVNPEYVEINNWLFKKYNKTTGAFNFAFTLKMDTDNSLSDHVVGFYFKNNEFKKSAIDFEVKICPLFEKLHSFDIGHMMENSNMTLKCPIKKGSYYVYDLIPDAANYPPLIPSGRWLTKQQIKLRGNKVVTLDYIATVEYL